MYKEIALNSKFRCVVMGAAARWGTVRLRIKRRSRNVLHGTCGHINIIMQKQQGNATAQPGKWVYQVYWGGWSHE